jgi:hypothetical protein
MRKLEGSDLLSNLLIVVAVSLAGTPLLLGDRLVPMVATIVNETFSLCQQVSTFLMGLIS